MNNLQPSNLPAFHLGLIGYPVSHSLSPKIQNAALKACGLEGGYSLFPIAPDDRLGLKEMLDRLRSGEISGLNVTLPHKQNVLTLVDELTPVAKAIGAVSVLYLRGHTLIGDNADAPGFLADLHRFLAESPSPLLEEGLGVKDKYSLVLGAGGSARAIVYALLHDGWDVTVAARRIEQAQGLADSFSDHQLQITNFTNPRPLTLRHGERETSRQDKAFDLFVNTTPLGMTPNIHISPLPDNLELPKDARIYDLVYNPRQTKLVRDARLHGLHATTGLGMLIEQAAIGFELWTGHKPPKDILYASVAG